MSALSELGRDERIARMALSIVAAPDDPATGQLLRRVGAAETLRLTDSDGPVPGMDRIEAGVWRDRIRSKGSPDQVAAQVAQLERSSFEVLIPGDAVWPTAVDDLGDRAPYVLWARGSAELLSAALSDRVTLTGARAATAYGEHVAGELAGGGVVGRPLPRDAFHVYGGGIRGRVSTDERSRGRAAGGVVR